jgi:hypothetical protein
MLVPKIVLTLVSFRFMQMELFASVLPGWFSDYKYGLMFRLGLLFGLVVLVWHAGFSRNFVRPRNALFLPASVGSAWVALWIGNLANQDYFFLVLTICGAIFLSLAHKFILGSSWKQVAGAVVLSPGIFYLWFFASGWLPENFRKSISGYIPCFWQAGYLAGIFAVGWLIAKRNPAAG